MKNIKPTLFVTLLFAGASAFILQTQKGASQANPPPQAQAFSRHYAEVNLTLSGLVVDEAGAHPGTGTLRLPVLDRTVRLSVTFRAENGDVAFGETAAFYKSSTGECAFQAGGTVEIKYNFPFFEFDASAAGIIMEGGPDGTLAVENFITSPGTLHVAFWY